MRKLLTSPAKMSMGNTEDTIYQTALKYIADLSLNLMAVKVEYHPEDFSAWCKELHRICKHDVNLDLLEDKQLVPLKKLQDTLESGISFMQLKMLRIAPWPIFVKFIHDVKTLQSIDERLALLKHVDSLRELPLVDMIEEDRLVFAGKHAAIHDISMYQFDVEWFASTKGAKTFHTLLQAHPSEFDDALAHIPLQGDVSFKQYQAFVSTYKAIFNTHTNAEKAPLAAATRLLAMRRPDVFIALTNAKIGTLCQGLSIAKFNNQDFDSYYQELILSLQSFAWYRQSAPENSEELALWNVRAALVDVFLFADEGQAANSNYLRLCAKPKKTKLGVARAPKRSKESAEMLVDKALAADDIPEYLLDMRTTIVNSVQKGKTVEQAITLMRTIFG